MTQFHLAPLSEETAVSVKLNSRVGYVASCREVRELVMPDFQVLELEVGDDDGTLLLEEKDTLDEEKKEESLREGNVALFFSGSEELLTLLSGFLPNPKLETSAPSVCNCLHSEYNTGWTWCCSKVLASFNLHSNPCILHLSIHSGKLKAASVAVKAVIFLANSESMIVIATLLNSRHVFFYVLSNTKEVVDHVRTMATLMCLSVVLDSLKTVLSALRAYVDLGTYYVFGIPVAAALGFLFKLRGPAPWIGLQAGAFLQTILLFIITNRTNWEKQARERILEERFSPENRLPILTEEI
ncbi:protein DETOXIFICATION 13 [Citrus sinensis]|uniref:Protein DETOXIFICATION 13 n=1 Tax=Citrus sinensis TaxID=2711 RepID=A0ACB8NB85_CITSI|nr:protein DETOXIFICATION 13 [Citrus sinensis]KAH9795087.1 protein DETOXIFICATION 13 [Citrus sinensis]